MMSKTEGSLMELRSERQGAEGPMAAAGQVDRQEGGKPLSFARV